MLGSGNNTIDIRVQVTINTNNNGSSSPTPPCLIPPNNQGYSLNNSVNNLANPAFVTPGTLSDLKKQRSLQYISRNNTFPANGTETP